MNQADSLPLNGHQAFWDSATVSIDQPSFSVSTTLLISNQRTNSKPDTRKMLFGKSPSQSRKLNSKVILAIKAKITGTQRISTTVGMY